MGNFMETYTMLADFRHEWAERQYRRSIQQRVIIYTMASGLMVALAAIAAFQGWI
jgi:hypothetical protein